MTDDIREELISAALDGERVDLQALREVLAEPGGRAAAAAFLLLRAAMAADTIEPRRLALAAAGTGRERPRVWSSRSMPRVPIGIAASIAALIAAGAFWLGSTWRIPNALEDASPRAAVASKPAAPPPAAGRAVTQQLDRPDAGAPPTPERVLRFTPGVDWHEGS